MPHRASFLMSLSLAIILCVGQPALSQATPATADTVLATVGDAQITVGHMISMYNRLPPQYQQLPAATLYEGMIEQMIDQIVLMQSLKGETPTSARFMLENENRAILANVLINKTLNSEFSEADIKAFYEKTYASGDQKTEYHAAHILVETEEEAKTLIEELTAGADFAEMAKAHSTGPSGPSGGDLGWFGDGMMVEPFFDAVAALKASEISDPVNTEFGWHVIKLLETRSPDRPALDSVRDDITDSLRQQALGDLISNLRSTTEISRTDPNNIDPSIISDNSLLEN